jgi:nickel/cobalt transporter (NiCoT) family protein
VGTALRRLHRSFSPGERRRLVGFLGLVALLHLVGWGMLLRYGLSHPAFLALGGVAYTFGLRHAFDADHIAAIDNTTRKLLQEGRRPMGAGFFFSLGHSTVVLLIAVGLGLAARLVVDGIRGVQLNGFGSLVGTAVSGVFLLLIGVMNLVILLDIAGVYRRMRRGEYDSQALGHELQAGGVLTKIFGRLFKLVRHSWQLYPIGFLFGLGFDTASEVAVLAIGAGAAAQGLPLLAVLSLPLVFGAGMSAMDTLDGAFMAKAYSWAFSNPVRKVFYNLTVTGLSVFVALFVGGVELAQILIRVVDLRGQPFDAVARLDFGSLGVFIVVAFVVTWVAAFAIFKYRRVEERWSALVEQPR